MCDLSLWFFGPWSLVIPLLLTMKRVFQPDETVEESFRPQKRSRVPEHVPSIKRKRQEEEDSDHNDLKRARIVDEVTRRALGPSWFEPVRNELTERLYILERYACTNAHLREVHLENRGYSILTCF